MNLRRILAGIIGVGLLGFGALFLPSFHQPAPSTLAPSDSIGSATSSVSLPFATNVFAANAARRTHTQALQAIAGIPDIDSHKAFGSKTAPVIMEVFSDYQCPACKQLFLGTNRQLMENYVTTGKVFLIHRDFPLPGHAHSRVAARYARAAAQIGKIEPVEEALFQNQEKWEQTGDVDGTVAAALSPAEMAKVRALVKSGTLEPMIDKDYALGQVYRVNQTPTTVFHSKGQTLPYSGVMSYEVLKGFLNQLLSQ